MFVSKVHIIRAMLSSEALSCDGCLPCQFMFKFCVVLFGNEGCALLVDNRGSSWVGAHTDACHGLTLDSANFCFVFTVIGGGVYWVCFICVSGVFQLCFGYGEPSLWADPRYG